MENPAVESVKRNETADKVRRGSFSKKELKDFYTLGDEIGRGSFSVVRIGTKIKDGTTYAIKCVDKKFIKVHLMEREIDIMKKVNHQNILKFYDVFEDADFIYLVLELVMGGELFDKIVERGNYLESDAVKIVKQILEAVKYLHDHNIVHRDLKPENLLCDQDFEKNLSLKVADFGLSRSFASSQPAMTTYCGSPEYVAPEVLACAPYEKAVDLWSVGVITYILLTGFLPFYDKNHLVLFEKIQNVEYNWDDCPAVTPQAKHFIQNLLVKDSKKRLTAEQALKHPWIRGGGSKKDVHLKPSFRKLLENYKAKKESEKKASEKK